MQRVYRNCAADTLGKKLLLALRRDYRLKSFFVLGPDNVLIEIVEARPIPDASWEK